MHFCYVADVRWWSLHRNGTGLVRYHNTEHSWDVVHVEEPNEVKPGQLEAYDLLVYGSVPAYQFAVRTGRAPRNVPSVVTCASFRDARLRVLKSAETGEELDVSPMLQGYNVVAFAINDRRMQPFVLGAKADIPYVYHPDHIDPEVFYPQPHISKTDKIRVGWAGSEKHWMGIKHVTRIQEAADRIEGIELVLQRREVEGCKTAEEMCDWYAGLDLYISANEELTPNPVPILESLVCGVPVLTTRCGEVWPFVSALEPSFILKNNSVKEIHRGLSFAVRVGKTKLDRLGRRLGRVASEQITWRDGAAELFTRNMEALCQAQR